MAKAKGRATKPKIGFMLDNSIVMAWSFEDESDEYADAVLDRLAGASVENRSLSSGGRFVRGILILPAARGDRLRAGRRGAFARH